MIKKTNSFLWLILLAIFCEAAFGNDLIYDFTKGKWVDPFSDGVIFNTDKMEYQPYNSPEAREYRYKQAQKKYQEFEEEVQKIRDKIKD